MLQVGENEISLHKYSGGTKGNNGYRLDQRSVNYVPWVKPAPRSYFVNNEI